MGGAEERYVTLMEGGAPTRLLLYTPLGASSETLPLHISLHGGAFIHGSADFDDHFCRKTANEGRYRVINVDFRLAPEFRFPYSVEECYRVLVWAAAKASAACCSTVPSST